MNPAAHVAGVEEVAIRQGRPVREALLEAAETWNRWGDCSGGINEFYIEAQRLARERIAQMEES